jgi:hypothetical protein
MTPQDGAPKVTCPECDGRGEVLDAPQRGPGTYWERCVECNGTGTIAAPGAPDIPAPTSKEKRAFMEGWRHGYYDGGEHDCRMFKPTAERAWQDYLSERRK